MVVKSQPTKKKFLNSINYFRGIAIILIVLGHCYGLAGWDISTNTEKLFYSLTLNGSVYFVFISGFLYNHIFYPRFEYKKFIQKKMQFVLLPYLLCSLVPVLLTVFIGDGGNFLPDSLRGNPFLATIWYLITGRINFAYWYIPMIMIVFAISPLINWIIRSNKILLAIFFLLPISLIVHRPIEGINPIHSAIYFLPVYLIGIWSSINNKKIYAYLKDNKKKVAIILLAIALGLIQVFVLHVSGNFHKEFWSITVPDVNLIQKILLCFLFMSILDIYENTDISSMKKTAETSFAIYFIHPFLNITFYQVAHKLNLNYQGNVFTLILATFLVVVISMAIAYSIKAIFKKNSRYIIGW